MIDHGKLAIFGANDGHVRLDLADFDHGVSLFIFGLPFFPLRSARLSSAPSGPASASLAFRASSSVLPAATKRLTPSL